MREGKIFRIKLRLFYFKPNRYHSTKSHESLNFDSFYSVHKYIDPNWLAWFIGFTLGDGGLHMNKNSFLFGITQSEESILQEINAVLGFGRVYFDSSANSFRYRVTHHSEILKLAILFNGKLVTENKIEQLGKWIQSLNKRGADILYVSRPFQPTLNDA